MSRVGTMLTLASLAALGYVGARRLGRWLDDPIGDSADDDDAPESPDLPRTGWRRWNVSQRAGQ